MRRVAWVFAAALLCAAALVLLFIWLLPRDTLKTRIGEQIAAWTGRDVSLRGEPELDFFPELTVTLQDVEVSGPRGMADAELISMDRLTGTVRLLPLLIGQVEIGSFTLVRPRVRLVLDQSGGRNWAFDSGAAALQLAFAGDVPLGQFVLEDGTVLYEDRQDGTTERLDSVNLTVEWGSVRQPVEIGGFGIWRGEQVSFSARAEAPFDFLRGDTTPVEARFDSAPLAGLFTGAAADINAPQLTGDLTMSTQSLRGFASWLGSPIGPGSTLGAASLSGAASFREAVLSVQNAQLSLDGNTATGALDVAVAARPSITGTLAFPELDLTSYFAGFSDGFGAGGDWRSVALGTGWFDDIGADIRLSAGSARIGALQFGDTAASVSLRDSRLEVGLAGAAFNGGSLSGALAVTHSADENALVEVQLRGAEFNIAQAAQALGRMPGVAGTASVATDVESRGKDLGSLAAGLSGTARLDLKDGAFPLLGLAEIAVGGNGANPQQTGIAAASPVKSLAIGFSLAGGVAVLERAAVSALSFTADAKGWIGLLDGTLGLNGNLTPSVAGTIAEPAIPFTVGGTIAQPIARPLAAAAN
jgi:AsmA protein